MKKYQVWWLICVGVFLVMALDILFLVLTGMSLFYQERDYIAGRALIGFISGWGALLCTVGDSHLRKPE